MAAAVRVAITRPVEDAERSAAVLRTKGAEVMLEPLLMVMPAAAVDLDLRGVQAFLLTSANGARALARELLAFPLPANPALSPFALPALCVGDQTLRTAESLGFRNGRSAQGDVISLAALARDSLSPQDGALLHAAGSARAGDLAELLASDGFEVRRTVLYETRKATAFSADFLALLDDHALDAVLFYSPRTAATFATLAGTVTIQQSLQGVCAYCLSPAVAEALAGCAFHAVRVAPQPTQDALFSVLEQDFPALTFSAPAESGGCSVLPVPRTTPSATNHGDRSMSDRPTAPDAKASAETPAPQDLASAAASETPDVSVTPEPEITNGETVAAADTTAAPAAGSKGKGKRVVGGLAVVLIAGLGAYASLPWWVGSLPKSVRPTVQKLLPAPSKSETEVLASKIATLRNTLAAVEGKVSALQSRVSVLEQAPAVTVAAPETPVTAAVSDAAPAVTATALSGDLDQRLTALEHMLNGNHGAMTKTLEGLRSDLDELKASRATASALLGLSDRVSGLESAVDKAVSRQDRALAFLLAVGQLRAAIEGGRGFEDELRTVQAMAPADLNVTELTAEFSGYATAGVPTLTSLQQSFVPLGAKVIRSTALPEEGESWWNRTVDRLLTVITIRRIDGEAVGTGPAAVVSRAEALLNSGALAEAVGEMSALTGAAAEVANAWMTQAQARLAADKTLNALTGTALAAVTASQTPAEPGKEG